ncbi:hypothetical protein C8R44DRAFT_973282 [Mycena epipterygia]|nr:hypothetical protein C8R44DRAFT_973282 [Mycena epipterygia]
MEAFPNEILCHIFKMASPSREEAIQRGRISLLDSPWTLTLVSSLWREIALSLPSLWSSLVISIESLTPSWRNYPVRLLQLQIARSGAHPLRIIFISQEAPGYTTERLFDIMVESCDRWETLELESTWPLKESSLSRMRGHLPLLREMYVCVSSSPDPLSNHDHLGDPFNDDPLRPRKLDKSIFDSTPQLQAARFVNPTHEHHATFFRVQDVQLPGQIAILPWTKLTSYTSTFKDFRLFERLREAQNLEECRAIVTLPDSWQPPAQPILFPHLRKLTLEGPPQIIQSLRLPALEELSICLYGSNSWQSPAQPILFPHVKKLMLAVPPRIIDSFLFPSIEELFVQIYDSGFNQLGDLLKRSGCSLRKLWIVGHLLAAQFLEALTHSPRISEIGIYGTGPNNGHNGDSIIAALTLPGAGGLQRPLFVPELTRLYIRSWNNDLDLPALLDMVESRHQLFHLHGCSRLESFSIFGAGVHVYGGGIPQRVEALGAAGLDAELTQDDEKWSQNLRTFL